MKAIIVTSGSLTGGVYHLGHSLVIGRGNECDIQITDPSASRRHARIMDQEGEQVLITDLESQNGLLVEEEPVKETKLDPGDSFSIGNVTFDYLLLDDARVESARPGQINIVGDLDSEEAKIERERVASATTLPPPRKD